MWRYAGNGGLRLVCSVWLGMGRSVIVQHGTATVSSPATLLVSRNVAIDCVQLQVRVHSAQQRSRPLLASAASCCMKNDSIVCCWALFFPPAPKLLLFWPIRLQPAPAAAPALLLPCAVWWPWWRYWCYVGAAGAGCNLIGQNRSSFGAGGKKRAQQQTILSFFIQQEAALASRGLLRCCAEWTRTCSWTQSMATFLETERVAGEDTVAVPCDTPSHTKSHRAEQDGVCHGQPHS